MQCCTSTTTPAVLDWGASKGIVLWYRLRCDDCGSVSERMGPPRARVLLKKARRRNSGTRKREEFEGIGRPVPFGERRRIRIVDPMTVEDPDYRDVFDCDGLKKRVEVSDCQRMYVDSNSWGLDVSGCEPSCRRCPVGLRLRKKIAGKIGV